LPQQNSALEVGFWNILEIQGELWIACEICHGPSTSKILDFDVSASGRLIFSNKNEK
jgi:hypothetical protein